MYKRESTQNQVVKEVTYVSRLSSFKSTPLDAQSLSDFGEALDEVGKTGSRRIATCLMNYPHGSALVSAAKVWLSQVEPPTLSKREDREERERERESF